MSNQIEIEWMEPTDFPEVLNPSQNGFSVDVLIYSESLKERTVGWFNFNKMKWHFLCREAQKDFKWRYFDDKIDKPNV